MMTQVEGDIVEAFYDLSLVAWHHALSPPLPLLAHPPPPRQKFDFGFEHAQIANHDLEASKAHAIATLKDQKFTEERGQQQPLPAGQQQNGYDAGPSQEAGHDENDFNSKDGEGKMQAITKRLNTTLQRSEEHTSELQSR